jgi:hypothetical protein
MKLSTRILPLLAALSFAASSAFGDNTNDHNNSGHTKYVEGDLGGALNDFNKAIELKPDADGYINRGVVKLAKADLDGAIADFNCKGLRD